MLIPKDPVRKQLKKVMSLIWNRSYRKSLEEKEIDEHLLLLTTRCKQLNKDPETVLNDIENLVKVMTNYSFRQALYDTLEIKNFTSYKLDGWKPLLLKKKPILILKKRGD